MIVRAATASDDEAIRDLLHDSDAYHAEFLPDLWRVPPEPRFTRTELAELIANEEHCLLLVADHDGDVGGFIEASVRVPEGPEDVDQPWCGINNLAVRADWRRQGIGRTLVRAVEEWAQRKGLMQTRLEVYEFNAGARTLYEQLGYVTYSRRMRKSLTEGPL